MIWGNEACVPRLLSPCAATAVEAMLVKPEFPESLLRTERSHCNGSFPHMTGRGAPAGGNQRKLTQSNEDAAPPKINKQK